ncbi:HAD-like domain-containing protein [Dimargaris cristalligena]|uniref:HAD-like domain-containing protein n=1 Tax=Dimargaris cristalligena TaxID=215637 RepID=A0A4P9ZVS7_9FUNG|nr:HAD-like domain-containing protein [Dimargaris cristalligena]|eukprot:RKP37697.1 HAD-like domain-containing protein [Dimargaris cristalligena]
MKTTLNIPENQDTLGYIHSLSEPARSKAEAVIVEIENRALEEMQLQPGLPELLKYLTQQGIHKAILTRNNVNSVNHMADNLFPLPVPGEPHPFHFDPILTRSFQPIKPDPAPLYHIAEQWGIQPEELMMVGDHADDLNCGNNAGAVSVLLLDQVNRKFVPLADLAVCSLDDIIDFLRDGFMLHHKK